MEYVALLRGINVGGKNMVSMKALKESFQTLRFQDVMTYINSGNVLFRSTEPDARKLERKIDNMLAHEHGLKGRTVVRSRAEMLRLKKVITETWKRTTADWRYNVIFLRHVIDSKDVLDSIVPKPEIERVVYCPGTLLWSARVSDLTRATMTKLSSKRIFQDMTVRNLNTTNKLVELLERMHNSRGV